MKDMDSSDFQEESSLAEILAKVRRFLFRRRWWILLPACGISLGTAVALKFIPNEYTSSATLLVVSQQVPQRYVVPNSTTDLGSMLEAMKQEVLSRTRLWTMINEFNLYPKRRQALAQEQVISLMLADISIEPLANPQQHDLDSFRISYTAETPQLARQITSTLTSLFINENLRTREQQATNTTRFLHEQVQSKGKRLEEQERRLRDFKLRHVNELPEQQQANLSILGGLQAQLQSATTAIARANQQRAFLQSQLDSYQRASAAMAAAKLGMPPDGNRPRTPTPLEIAQAELTRLEAQRTQLSSFTPQHPDVAKNQRETARMEETVRRLKAQAADSETKEGEGKSALAQLEDPSIAQTKSQLEANRLEIETLVNEEKRLKTTIAQYENRLNQTPYWEQEQAGILRDTEALRLEYADLLKKEQESQLATNLEKQQGGQQFRLVDAASLPAVPSSPKRMKISLIGTVIGLALGLGLAAVIELRDTALYSEKDLAQFVSAPIAVTIPQVATRVEDERGRWRGKLEFAAGSALVLMVLLAQVYVYRAH